MRVKFHFTPVLKAHIDLLLFFLLDLFFFRNEIFFLRGDVVLSTIALAPATDECVV